ncbi:MAG TPA: hypothetical protein VGJ20_35670 [Xanthobacteraceae bacterium]
MLDVQYVNVVYVYRVGAGSTAKPVAIKLTIPDRDGCARLARRENAILIIDKFDAIDSEAAFIQSNARAVHISYTSSCKRQVPHGRIICLDDKEPFSHTRFIGDDDARLRALYYQVIRAPYCTIKILPGLDFNMIALLCDLCRGRR